MVFQKGQCKFKIRVRFYASVAKVQRLLAEEKVLVRSPSVDAFKRMIKSKLREGLK